MSRWYAGRRLLGLLLLGSLMLGSCSSESDRTESAADAPANGVPLVQTYTVINTFPHDRQAFTQGLVLDAGVLYEGTGLNGSSSIRQVDLATGRVLKSRALERQFFGEGITIFGPHLIQLTWRSKVGFVYDKTNFTLLRQFTYPTEGWGITHDGQRLLMSDGTATLYWLDPETLTEIGQLQVQDNQGPVVRLNELEYVQGRIYANVWQTNRIAQIHPQSGRVTAWIDLTDLLSAADRAQPVDILNGIAYDADQNRLFVTGKLWPKLFEIELRPTP